MPVKLPHAKKLATHTFKDEEKTYAAHKKKIERWIDEKLLPDVKMVPPKIDLKKRTVSGCAAVECPMEYYGHDGISADQWKELYESIIKPLGYEPVYTHDGGGMYSMVGVKWSVPL
jgi:hypothetical protein